MQRKIFSAATVLAVLVFFVVNSGSVYAINLFGSSFFNKNKVLEYVDTHYSGGRHKVVIHFTVPVQLQKKSLRFTGRTINIPVEIHPENVTGETVGGNPQIIWQPTDDIPLSQVSYENSLFSNALLILDFIRKTPVRVYQGKDKKTITVEVEKKGFEKEGRYVVNLLATKKRVHLEDFANLDEFDGGRLYVKSRKKNGETLYLLKVGDYQTSEQAEKVAENLQKHYPGAFVTGLSGVVYKTIRSGKKEKSTTVSSAFKKKKFFKPNSLGDEKLAQLMAAARKAVTKKQLDKAIKILNTLLQSEENKYTQEAMELLGVARERKGQIARARAQYEKYLQAYPEGKNSDRVRQRLLVVVTAEEDIDADKAARRKATREDSTPLEFFGGLSQFYRKTAEESSDLFTFFDLAGKKRVNGWDTRTQIRGTQTTAIEGNVDTSPSLSDLYIDATQRAMSIAIKAGRQRLNNNGVFGRFDGAVFSYFDDQDRKYNLLLGKPVENAEDNFLNKHKTFFGASVDFPLLNESMDVNSYFFSQKVDGITDRRALGVESSYFREGLTLFSLLDYDLSYREINIFLASGNWRPFETTTFHITYDLRKNPFLSTVNALQGQTVSSVSELLQTLTEENVRQLARDNTSLTRLYNLGVSHTLDKRTRLRGDVTLSSEDLNQLDGNGVVSATPSATASNNYFYSLQAIRDGFFKENDVSILQYSYSDTSSAISHQLNASTRLPVGEKLRVISQMRLTVVNSKTSEGGATLRPDIRLEYRFNHDLTFEVESNIDLLNNNAQVGAGNLANFFLSAGYRWIF